MRTFFMFLVISLIKSAPFTSIHLSLFFYSLFHETETLYNM